MRLHSLAFTMPASTTGRAALAVFAVTSMLYLVPEATPMTTWK